MVSWSGTDTYKRWKYAVETDFHGLDDSSIKLQTINVAYDSCDRFLPFDRSVEATRISYAINGDETWLAVAVGSDIDLYDLKTGRRQGVFAGHANPLDEVVFVPDQLTKLVSWSYSDGETPGPTSEEQEIIVWSIKDDVRSVAVEQAKHRSVIGASKNSVENLQALLDEQNSGIELEATEKSELLTLLTTALSRIARRHLVGVNVKLDGRLASRFQSSIFNHAGDTLIYLPGPRPRSNGDAQWDIGLYDIPSGITKTLTGHRDAIVWIGFSSNDSLVASAGWDGTFRVWDAETGEQRFKWVTDEQNWAGAFKPDGTQFLGTDGGGDIVIWDLETGDVVTQYKTGHHYRRHIDWSPDGRYIAVGGDYAGEILLFDTRSLIDDSGNMVPVQKRVLDVKAVSDDEMIQNLVSSSLAIRRVTWTGRGRRLFSSMYGEVAAEIVDFDLNVKWRILPCERTDNEEADWARLPKLSTPWEEPFRPGISYLALSDEVALVCHDGVRIWKLRVGEE